MSTIPDVDLINRDPTTYAKKCTPAKLRKIVALAKDLYYNSEETGGSGLDDYAYDILEDRLKKIEKTNKLNRNKNKNEKSVLGVGAPLRDDIDLEKVPLPFFMGSMNKAMIKVTTNASGKVTFKRNKEMEAYLKNYSADLVYSDKLDGISGLIHCDDDGTVSCFTRGNGAEGRNITHILKFIKIPNLPKGTTVRGEFIMKKSTWEAKYEKTESNARNFVSGKLNAKSLDPDAIRDVDFVAYELIKYKGTVGEHLASEGFEIVSSLGFKTVFWKSLNKQDVSAVLLGDEYFMRRSEGEYMIDGIIVTNDSTPYPPNTSGNPEHSIAFKMDGVERETVVQDIIWQQSQYNKLKPVASIRRTVIGGVNIDRVTCYNAKYVTQNGLGRGARILVIRSGEVIPKITKVLIPAEETAVPSVPHHWNETRVEYIADETNDSVIHKQLASFFTKLDILGLKETTIAEIYGDGLTTIEDICNASETRFQKIERFQKRLAKKVHSNIHAGLRKATFAQLMAGSNVFPMGIGRRKIKMIFDDVPDLIGYQDGKFVCKYSEDQVYEKVLSVEGYAEKTTRMVSENMSKFVAFLNRLPQEDLVHLHDAGTSKASDGVSSPFEGLTFVFSGYRPKDKMAVIEAGGGSCKSSVSKNTDFVVTDNPDGETSKVTKARSLGVPVLSIVTFNEMFFREGQKQR